MTEPKDKQPPVYWTCQRCNGVGVLPERDEWGFGKSCPVCHGRGMAYRPW